MALKKLIVLVPEELIRQVDLWWRKRPEVANRSDAVRVLLARGIEEDEGRQGDQGNKAR